MVAMQQQQLQQSDGSAMDAFGSSSVSMDSMDHEPTTEISTTQAPPATTQSATTTMEIVATASVTVCSSGEAKEATKRRDEEADEEMRNETTE